MPEKKEKKKKVANGGGFFFAYGKSKEFTHRRKRNAMIYDLK